jgi:hypothetical protein
MQRIFVEESSPKSKRTILVRHLFLAVCLFVLTSSAYAITCPAYPANVSVSLGSGAPPGEPQIQSVTSSASLVGGSTDVLCTYTVHVTPVYTPTGINPINLIRCPTFGLSLTILAPDNPPMPGFSPWAFGAPGTPEGSSSTKSAPQIVSSAFSMIFLNLDGRRASITSCKVINNGIFTFAMYSSTAAGDTCTASGGTVTCTAPPCPDNVPGSSMPAGVYNASTSQFGYVAEDTLIFNPNSTVPIEWPASMSAIKSAMGASFNSASFTLQCGSTNGPQCEQGAPNSPPAFVCVYDSPQFQYQSKPAKAQVTVQCSGSCGSL